MLQSQADIAGSEPQPDPLSDFYFISCHGDLTAPEFQSGQMVVRVMSRHDRFNDRRRLAVMGHRQVKPGEHVMDPAPGHHLARFQQHQIIRQAGDFIWRMTDIDHRNIQLAMQGLDIRQDLLLTLQFQGGQRFIHQ